MPPFDPPFKRGGVAPTIQSCEGDIHATPSPPDPNPL